MSDFSIFARDTAISKGYWPEDVEEYKKYLLANDGERIFSYVVCYDLKIELTTKTDTYAEYRFVFVPPSHHFNRVVEK